MQQTLPPPVIAPIVIVVLPGMMMCGCVAYWYAWQRAQALASVAKPRPALPFDPTLN